MLGAGVAGIHEVVDAFGRPREARVWRLGRRTVVESADVLPYDPRRLEPEAASSRGLGELLAALDCEELVVCLGGTATLDAGAGLLSVLRRLPCPTTALWDTDATLLEAPRLYGPQKGLSPDQVPEWEARFAALEEVRGVAELPGSGAAGGLGAAFAALGARLVPGAAFVLDTLGFEPASYDPVVTGEGSVDATTRRGKAPGEVARRCEAAAVRCVVFGGRVVEPFPGVETVPLSGDPARARDDLVALGEDLATRTRRPA